MATRIYLTVDEIYDLAIVSTEIKDLTISSGDGDECKEDGVINLGDDSEIAEVSDANDDS